MNTKHLYKALCLLAVLTVHQANAARLLNPAGPGYNVVDNCSGCLGFTNINVNIQANTPIVLEFDPLGFPSEDIHIRLTNYTGAAWSNLTIEYNSHDPYSFNDVIIDLHVLGAGTSTPTIDGILINPYTGLPSGLAISFAPLNLTGLSSQAL